MQTRAPAFFATGSNRTSHAPTFTQCLRTSGAAVGLGTPALPDGCIGRASSGYSDFVCGAKRYSSIPAYRVAGEVTRSLSGTTLRTTRFLSRTPVGSAVESL